MKKHQLFLDTYHKIEDEKERLGFLRGYLFALNSKEMTRFMLDNFEMGFQAYEQVYTNGSPFEKSAAKKDLDKQISLLKKHPAASA